MKKEMTVIIEDKKLRNIKLSLAQIDLILEELERMPHNLFVWYGKDIKDLIKKLKEARKK